MPDVSLSSLGEIGFKIRIEGWQKIVGALRNIPETLQWTIESFGKQAFEDMRFYPPQQSHMRYKRTYRLYSGWRLEVKKTFFQLGNSVWYAPLVQSTDQLPVHRETGWLTDEEELYNLDAVNKIESELQRVLDQI